MVEVDLPNRLKRSTSDVSVTVTVRNESKQAFCAVNDPHEISIIVQPSLGFSNRFTQTIEGEGHRFDPREKCIISTSVPHKNPNVDTWLVFAQIRLRREDQPVPKKPPHDWAVRFSPGVLLTFDP